MCSRRTGRALELCVVKPAVHVLPLTSNPKLVYAGALNFRDVMLAYGKLSRDLMAHGKGGDYIGLEFSGKVTCRALQPPSLSIIHTRSAQAQPKLLEPRLPDCQVVELQKCWRQIYFRSRSSPPHPMSPAFPPETAGQG